MSYTHINPPFNATVHDDGENCIFLSSNEGPKCPEFKILKITIHILFITFSLPKIWSQTSLLYPASCLFYKNKCRILRCVFSVCVLRTALELFSSSMDKKGAWCGNVTKCTNVFDRLRKYESTKYFMIWGSLSTKVHDTQVLLVQEYTSSWYCTLVYRLSLKQKFMIRKCWLSMSTEVHDM